MQNQSTGDTTPIEADSASTEHIILKRALWDTNISPALFLAILRGEESHDWPTRAFCVARLLECANWYDVVKIIPPRDICSLWPEAQRYVRTTSIKKGMEYACRVLQ